MKFLQFSYPNALEILQGAVGVNCWGAKGFSVGVPVPYNQLKASPRHMLEIEKRKKGGGRRKKKNEDNNPQPRKYRDLLLSFPPPLFLIILFSPSFSFYLFFPLLIFLLFLFLFLSGLVKRSSSELVCGSSGFVCGSSELVCVPQASLCAFAVPVFLDGSRRGPRPEPKPKTVHGWFFASRKLTC